MIISKELALLYGKPVVVFPKLIAPLLPVAVLSLPNVITEFSELTIWKSVAGFVVPIPIEPKDPTPDTFKLVVSNWLYLKN